MNRFSPDLTREIKSELQKELRKTKNLKKISTEFKDRDFHIDLNDLTISELDFEMGKRASLIRDNLDPRVYINRKPGRNRVEKILLLFPFLFNFLFRGSFQIIKNFFAFNSAMLVRMRKADEKIGELEGKISALEDRTSGGDL